MTLQDAQRRFFLQQLGEVSGALPDLAVAYYKAMLDGTISPGGEVGSADITDATSVGRAVLTAATAAAARAAIGAGTSNLTIGTTASTAKAGNYTPPTVTTTADGLMLSADKVKLNGIAANATANATNAELRNRATHTGTQAMSTISGLEAALEAKATTEALALLEARVAALETAE